MITNTWLGPTRIVKERRQLIDATAGGKTRSVIVAVTGQVLLSAVQSETIWKRIQATVGQS